MVAFTFRFNSLFFFNNLPGKWSCKRESKPENNCYKHIENCVEDGYSVPYTLRKYLVFR